MTTPLPPTAVAVKLACEFSGPQTITDDIVKNPIPIKDGYAKPWDALGLGVELDEKRLAKYAGKTIVCELRRGDSVRAIRESPLPPP